MRGRNIRPTQFSRLMSQPAAAAAAAAAASSVNAVPEVDPKALLFYGRKKQTPISLQVGPWKPVQ
jgi:hypothetical protein